MKGQPVTDTDQPARRSSPLRGAVIALIIALLFIEPARDFIAEWAGIGVGFAIAALICMFIYLGGARIRR